MHTSPALYVMISHTSTRFGKLIRRLTRFEYNHVSLSLDPSYRRWITFGRYTRTCCMYGGFITESPERFLADDPLTPVRIFRLPITVEQQQHLEKRFAAAGDRNCGLIYNTFDIPAAIFHTHWPITNAHTCLSFACDVLDRPVDSIIELDKQLTPYLVFDGNLSEVAPDNGERTDPFFERLRFADKWRLSVSNLTELTARALRRRTIIQ